MNAKYILTGLCLTLCFTACDVLDQTPESSFTPENFYKNADDAKAAVSSVYDLMNTAEMYNQVMWILQDQATDDSEWGGGRSTANQAKNDLDKYTLYAGYQYFPVALDGYVPRHQSRQYRHRPRA